MAEGNFEAKYNLIRNELEKKLKTDPRMKEVQPFMSFSKGSPEEDPKAFPAIFLGEGSLTDFSWDSGNAEATISLEIEIWIKARDRERGVEEIRKRCLKTFDTLCGTINDRRLEVAGVALANGSKGVKVVNCDFGYFVPSDDGIIYKGMLTVEVDVIVPLT